MVTRETQLSRSPALASQASQPRTHAKQAAQKCMDHPGLGVRAAPSAPSLKWTRQQRGGGRTAATIGIHPSSPTGRQRQLRPQLPPHPGAPRERAGHRPWELGGCRGHRCGISPPLLPLGENEDYENPPSKCSHKGGTEALSRRWVRRCSPGRGRRTGGRRDSAEVPSTLLFCFPKESPTY